MMPMMSALVGAAGGGPGATLVGALWGTQSTTTTPISFPVGTQAGDLAMIMSWGGFASSGSISGGAGGWSADHINWLNYGYRSSLLWKVLAAGDLAGVNFVSGSAGSAYVVAVYRGATSLAVKQTNTGGGGSEVPFSGFTKASNSKALVTIMHDRGPSSTPAAPAEFVRRTGGGAIHFAAWLADLLNTSRYDNGDPLKWTDAETALDQVGWLLELT